MPGSISRVVDYCEPKNYSITKETSIMKGQLHYGIVLSLKIFLLAIILSVQANAQCISAEGGAIINEFSNGKIKNQEFIELLIIGNGDGENVNLQGYILDDNNQATKGVGNEPGHVILGPCFSDLSPGQLILIYKSRLGI